MSSSTNRPATSAWKACASSVARSSIAVGMSGDESPTSTRLIATILGLVVTALLRNRLRVPGQPVAAAQARIVEKPLFDQGIDCARFKMPVGAAYPGLASGQKLDALIDMADGIDVKRSGFGRCHDIGPQHQMLHIGCGNN